MTGMHRAILFTGLPNASIVPISSLPSTDGPVLSARRDGGSAIHRPGPPRSVLFAHRHQAHRVLVFAEARDDPTGMAAGDAEDILDASFVKHAADQLAGKFGLGEHSLDRHDVILAVL
jgi:hypothetical protein